MSKRTTHADQDAGVLYQVIGKKELGAHNPHIRTLQIAHQLFDKAGAYDLGIVVEQKRVVALANYFINLPRQY